MRIGRKHAPSVMFLIVIIIGMGFASATIFLGPTHVIRQGTLTATNETIGDPTVTTLTSPNAHVLGAFGGSVAISGSIEVVGAPAETSVKTGANVSGSGNAYVFTTAGSLMATLTSQSPEAFGFFGWSVAVNGATVAVGAPGETVAGVVKAGHVYLFSTSGSFIATLSTPNPQTDGGFGTSVAVGGNTVFVGAPFEGAGNVYVYTTTGSVITTLTGPNLDSGDGFGLSVAVSGTNLVVGAPFDAGLSGSAFIFNTSGSLIASLSNPTGNVAFFGKSVAVSGNSVVVGAPVDSAGVVDVAGLAYIFSTVGSLISTLTSFNPEAFGDFGWSVAISGNNVVVGADRETAAGLAKAGSAYVFSATGSPNAATLSSPNPLLSGGFGNSVAVEDNTLLVGAPVEGSLFIRAGVAYSFTPSATSVTVDCNPSTVAVNQATQCTANVVDTSSNPLFPTGIVAFSSSGLGSFVPFPSTCRLLRVSTTTSSCLVRYTPSPGSEGTQTISAFYLGDFFHQTGTGTTTLVVTKRTSSTSVSCFPTTITPHHSATCTAVVTDTSPGTPITPKGTVVWTSSGRGMFSSPSCIVSGGGPLATCTVIFTATPGIPIKADTIRGTYGGDGDQFGSSGSTTITIL